MAGSDEPGQSEGRAAVGHQAHAREGGGERRPGVGEAHVAGEGEIQPEPRHGAPDLGHDRERAAHDGEHRRLEVGQPALQIGGGGERSERSKPVEIEAGAEVTPRAVQHHQVSGAALLDQLQLVGDGAREARSERVAAGGPVERQPVDRPLLPGQQLFGHRLYRPAGGVPDSATAIPIA